MNQRGPCLPASRPETGDSRNINTVTGSSASPDAVAE